MPFSVPRNAGDIIQAEKNAYRANLPPPDDDWPVDVRMLASHLREHLFEIDLTVEQAEQHCGLYDHNICGRFAHFVEGVYISDDLPLIFDVTADHVYGGTNTPFPQVNVYQLPGGSR